MRQSVKKIKSLSRFLLLAFMILCGAVLAPKPAQAITPGVWTELTEVAAGLWEYAEKAAAWVKEQTVYIQLINAVYKIINFFSGDFMDFADQNAKRTAIFGESIKHRLRIKERITQAKRDNMIASVERAVRTEHYINHAGASVAEQFLCNLLLSRQVLPVMTSFARIVSFNVTDGILRRYRAKTSDGDGPQYSADAWALKCGEYGEGRPKTGDPLDGTPKECQADSALPNAGYASADVSANALARDKVLTIPPIKTVTKTINGVSQTVRDFVPDPDSRSYDAQRSWLVARQYCYTLAGPRPTPPRDEEKDTPQGAAKWAQYITCQARHSHAVKQCADRLGKLTRPDCSNDDFKAFCEASVEACDAAREAKIALPPEYNDCSNGLSLYQAEYLSAQLCGSNRRVQADINAGTAEKKSVSSLLLCQIMRENWEKQVQDEERAFTRATQALSLMGDCWGSTGR